MVASSPSGTRRRIFGAMLFLPIIALIFHSQSMAQWLLMPLALAMTWEFVSMLAMPWPLRIALMFDVCLFAFPASLLHKMESAAQMSLFPVFLALGLLVVGFVWMVTRNGLATLFLGVVILCILSARGLLGLPDGHVLLISLAVVVAACDIAAYFTGRRIGGPRLAPRISPNKTRSGAAGGILGAVIACLAVIPLVSLSPVQAVVGGVVIAILAQTGDLFESALKRNLGVKDSGNLIPGHGGFLDRFDGYLLTLPVMWLYMM